MIRDWKNYPRFGPIFRSADRNFPGQNGKSGVQAHFFWFEGTILKAIRANRFHTLVSWIQENRAERMIEDVLKGC